MDDSQAIHRLKKGDISGLEILIARYQEKAIRTAYLITHDIPTAEDAVQETFVRVYERIRYFNEDRPFEPYLLRSVINTALNRSKKTLRWVSLNEEVEPELVGQWLAQASSTEDEIEYFQLKQKIKDALGKLSPRQRTAIVQRYYLDMSEKEMSQALNVAPGTVKWLLNEARQRLRTFIGLESEE
jgi:RNA polymerase sigma-70 factor, ECF subfamily